MQFYLQMGYGMLAHARSLVSSWGGGSVILSPRDGTEAQLCSVATDLKACGGTVLCDPQAYSASANHSRLVTHPHWPVDYSAQSVRRLIDYNRLLQTQAVILPAPLTVSVDEPYLARQIDVLNVARAYQPDEKYYSTIALKSTALESRDNLDALFDSELLSETDGVYLVLEHPQKAYLIRDAAWLAGALDVVAAARLRRKPTIVGYASHQMLLLAASGATAIASGTWQNVRSFDVEKFSEDDNDDPSRRATWYYAPQALSEYKVATLQLAYNARVLKPLEYATPYSNKLFGSVAPAASGYTEQESFRHYLTALRNQVLSIDSSSFDATVAQHQTWLTATERLISTYTRLGVIDRDRSFRDSIEAHRQALAMHVATRGPVLRRAWSFVS